MLRVVADEQTGAEMASRRQARPSCWACSPRVSDPHGEVRMTWDAKEATRGIYDLTDPDPAGEYVCDLATDTQDQVHPPEVRSLGRTLARWFEEITAWHKALVSNGPTEAVNNLMKRIKRIGFGFRSFLHYRVRVLLYAGRLEPPPHPHTPLKSDEPLMLG
jgi:Transposase